MEKRRACDVNVQKQQLSDAVNPIVIQACELLNKHILEKKEKEKCAENLNDFIQVSLKMWWRMSAVETKMHTVCLYPDVFMQMIFK